MTEVEHELPIEDPVLGEEDPERAFEDPEEERVNDEARGALAEAVSSSAAELRSLASNKLGADLLARVIDAATQPATNPLEAIRNPAQPSGRLDVLQGRLDQALDRLIAGDVSQASVDFLHALCDLDLADIAPQERGGAAKTLLTHLVYAATGKPLGLTILSDAAEAVKTVAEKLNGLTDSAYWEALAAAYDGESTPPDELSEHLVFMGLTGELKPMTEPFTWHSADAVSFQVDQLIAAASPGEGSPVDMAAMYRRAAGLTAGAHPIPRAVTAELVRMAVAELMAGTHPSVGAFETPSRQVIERALVPEPQMSDPNENNAVQQRNQVRLTAEKVLDAVRDSGAIRGRGLSRAEESQRRVTRGGRGFLGELLRFRATRLSNGARRIPDGKKTADNLDMLVETSEILEALDGWSEAYRAGTSDPAKLNPLLDRVQSSARWLDTALRSALKITAADALAGTLLVQLQVTAMEVAYEATELLRNGGASTWSQIDAVATLVENVTRRGQNRVAAQGARDGELGLGEYVTRTARGYEKTPWFSELKSAADAWSVADSRDLKSFGQATSAFAQAGEKVAGDIKALPPMQADQAALAQGILDALSSAVLDRVERIRAVDPQGLSEDLVTKLRAGLSTATGPADLAQYWRTGKKIITGKLPSGMDAGLADKLARWQKLAAGNADPAALAKATYGVVEAIVDYRTQVESRDNTNTKQDKAILLGLLDDLLTRIGWQLDSVRGASPARA